MCEARSGPGREPALNPRATLLLTAAALAAVTLSARPGFGLAVCALAVGCALRIGTPPRTIVGRLLAPLFMATVLIALQGALIGQHVVCSWPFPLHLEGLTRGALMGARVLGAMSVVMLTWVTTPMHRIMSGLRALGVPASWIEIASFTVRYLRTLTDDSREIAAAQRVRLGYVGTRRALSSMGILCGEVLIRSVDQAERTATAMQLRGYRGAMVWPPVERLAARDGWALLLGLLLLATAWMLLEGPGSLV